MFFKYSSGKINELKADSLVFFVLQMEKITDKKLKELDDASHGTLSTLIDSQEFTGKKNEISTIYNPEGYNVERVILVGLGEKKNLQADSFRQAAGVVSRYKSLMSSSKAIFSFGKFDKNDYFQATIEGYLLGSHKFLEFKTGEDKKDKNALKEITFVVENQRHLQRLEKAIERGRIIAEGQLLVRDLSSTPSNFLTPKILAQKAQKLARSHKIGCRILDEKAIVREKMGAFLSVARGAKEPPRFIVLEYKGAPTNQRPIVLVGKGITFDSGGISLKPSLNMHYMKGDMTGAAVVLASLVTAARLKLRQNIVGLLPATENMPSSTATKPGDIVTSRKGLTVEVINTDAEGRLILADALDYANKFKPQAVIDVATLTGATLYILGYAGAPIMGNNPKLLQRLKDASQETAERVWELPIWDVHREQMKSTIADVVNSGGRPAGTITAAAFLENFIGDYNWVHVDIASVDMEPKGTAYIPKGITGIGLRLFVELLSNWKKL
ncbi:MAG: leucyl aminopeptidase [FCB group bacterium]|nr:leucyl aminopeptidase [FCB group bacterium]